MIYAGLNAEYPFPIPTILCPTMGWLARLLGINIDKLKQWETNGGIPTRTLSGANHDRFWTEDNAKEACIKSLILMHRG